MDRTFLITGGAGYIGTNLIYYFIKNNYKIIIVDNFSNSNKNAIIRLEKYFNIKLKIYDGNLCDYDFLNNIFAENSITDVVHLAAKKYIAESFKFEQDYLDNNLISTKNLLDCMKKHDVYNIYFASSISVYGDPKYLPIDLNHPLSPQSPYAKSKVLCEEMIEQWQKTNESYNAIIFRFTNPVGARNEVMLGDDPTSEYSTLLPYLVRCMEQNKNISINGNNHPTKDGTTVRDYIDITDLTWCVYKICTLKLTGLVKIIIGNGKLTYSVLDIIHSLESIYNRKIPYIVNPARPNDTPLIEIDNSFIVNNINYSPKCSIYDIVKSQVNFEKFKNSKKIAD